MRKSYSPLAAVLCGCVMYGTFVLAEVRHEPVTTAMGACAMILGLPALWLLWR